MNRREVLWMCLITIFLANLVVNLVSLGNMSRLSKMLEAMPEDCEHYFEPMEGRND